MEVTTKLDNVPERRVSSNFCNAYVVRQIRFKECDKDSNSVPKRTWLKYNHSMFAGTKDQLTELCLRRLMEKIECQEKLIVESIEPTKTGLSSTITLSHKFEVPVGQAPSKTMEVRCLTSWVPLKEEKGTPDSEGYQKADVPLSNIYNEDSYVLYKLHKQFKNRRKLCLKYGMRRVLPKERLFEKGKEPWFIDLKEFDERRKWKRVPKGRSYVGALPVMFHFSGGKETYTHYPPGEIIKFVQSSVGIKRFHTPKTELSTYPVLIARR